MTTAEILSTLRERGVTLAVEDGKLLYRGSKDVLTPELIGEMRRCKAELIALIEAEQAAASAAPASPSARPRAPTIPRAGRDQPIALAPPQESLWFLHKVAPDNVADHVWAAWSLVGRLDRTAFARTLDTLIARHEALRLHMIDDGAQGLQRVSDPFPAPLEYHSIRHLAPVEREGPGPRG